MYAAWITMKNLKVYDGCATMDITSIDQNGNDIPFDPIYPQIHVTKFNYTGSLTHPEYKDLVLNLSEIWLIGKQYYPVKSGESQYIYVDDAGVNHPNAIKALKEKEKR
jgi:hypothetical protein